MDFNWTSIPSVNKRVFCNKSRIKSTLFVVYLMQKQFTKEEEKAVLHSHSVNEPTETVPKWRIFCEKGWEADRSMGSRYQKKTNTSHQSARVRFHPGNGFLCLSPVHIDSCLSFPDISIFLTPPASLIWGCLLLVMEKNSLESRKKRAIASDGDHGRWLFVSQLNAVAERSSGERSASSPEQRSSSSLISSWTRRRRRSCKISCSCSSVSKPRRSRWWSLSLSSARPGGSRCTGRKHV